MLTASKVSETSITRLFREHLTKAQVVEELFTRFDQILGEAGFRAQKGQIIDASIVRDLEQCNGREENRRAGRGEEATERRGCPVGQEEQQERLGDENHISVDVKHKLP